MRVCIDPGAAGGIAIENEAGEVKAYSMPKTDTGITELFQTINQMKPEGSIVSVMMEQVSGFIGTHPVEMATICPNCGATVPYVEQQGQPGSFMFNFGNGYGFLRGCCLMAGFRFEQVTPRTWQKALGLSKDKGMGKTEWKNILKDRAQKLFPQIKVTLSTADALLILEFSRRVVSNYHPPVKEEEQVELPF
jgi:hypothetical protein